MFREEDHPRKPEGSPEGGRFTKKEYSAMTTDELKKIAVKEYRQNTPYEEIVEKSKKESKKWKSKDDFFGVEYTGVKGRDAVDLLLKERQGHVKNAFYRKEIGDIDLPWGDEYAGLAHVIKRRDEMKMMGKGNITGLEMVKKIPDIIGNGAFVIDEHDRLSFQFDGYKVGIKPTYFGEKLNWVVSAMEIIK